MDINNIINKFILENLSAEVDEISMISGKYNKVSEVLSWIVFQSWSYARETHIKPVNDLDMIDVLGIRSLKEYNSDILEQVHDVLSKNKTKIWYEHLKKQSRSIWIYFDKDESKFSIDVVPAIPTEEIDIYWKTIYQIPQSYKLSKSKRVKFEEKILLGQAENGWKLSTPKWYIQYATNLDERTDKNFRLATRFIKIWKKWFKNAYEKNQSKDFPIKSFHLELIVGNVIEKYWVSSTSEILLLIFNDLYTYFSDKTPKFIDIAYQKQTNPEYVDEYLKTDIEDVFLSILNDELNRINTLLNSLKSCDNENSLLNIIKQILRLNIQNQGPIISSNHTNPWAIN